MIETSPEETAISLQVAACLPAIKAALASHPSRTLTGSQLHALIRMAAPSLDIREAVSVPQGKGALGRFAAEYLSDAVRVEGRSGSDWVYLILSQKDAIPTPSTNTGQIAWTAFVSPSTSLRLVLNATKDGFQVRQTGASEDEKIPSGIEVVSPSEIVILPLSRDELKSISDSFVNTIPADKATFIGQRLSATPNYLEWTRALAAMDRDEYQRWIQFRISEIIGIFVSRLKAADVTEENAGKLAKQLREAQSARFVSRKSSPLPTAGIPQLRPSPTVAPSVQLDLDVLRKVVELSLPNLTEAELRAIKLPVGIVFDLLTQIYLQNKSKP